MSNNKDMEVFKERIEKDSWLCRKHIYGCQDGKYNSITNQMEYEGKKPEIARVFMLVGYCPDTFTYFKAMIEVAKKSFPHIKECDITCGKVTRSNCVKGFTLITFVAKNEPVEGWNYDAGGFDFNF